MEPTPQQPHPWDPHVMGVVEVVGGVSTPTHHPPRIRLQASGLWIGDDGQMRPTPRLVGWEVRGWRASPKCGWRRQGRRAVKWHRRRDPDADAAQVIEGRAPPNVVQENCGRSHSGTAAQASTAVQGHTVTSGSVKDCGASSSSVVSAQWGGWPPSLTKEKRVHREATLPSDRPTFPEWSGATSQPPVR